MKAIPTERLEHVNITVKDIDPVVQFLQTALPTWRVRGGGTMDWFGKPIRWLHLGTDDDYLALQGEGEGEDLHWTSHHVGVKHVGIVVPSLEFTIERLAQAGYAIDHRGGASAFRKSAYFVCTGSLQFEFVEYLTADEEERNDYAR